MESARYNRASLWRTQASEAWLHELRSRNAICKSASHVNCNIIDYVDKVRGSVANLAFIVSKFSSRECGFNKESFGLIKGQCCLCARVNHDEDVNCTLSGR